MPFSALSKVMAGTAATTSSKKKTGCRECLRLGVQTPAATDLGYKNRYSPTAKRSEKRVSLVLKCHHFKQMPRVTGVARWRTLNAQWPWVPSLGQNFKSPTSNGYVSIWMKNSRVGRKTPNKQAKSKLKAPTASTLSEPPWNRESLKGRGGSS